MLPQVETGAKLERVITALQAVLKFLIPFESPLPWKELPYFNLANVPAWARAANQRPEFTRDALGWVCVRGNAIATASPVTTLAVLPAGFRPQATITVPAAVFAGGLRQFVSLDIQPNGRIVYITGPALVAGVEVQMNFRFDTRG